MSLKETKNIYEALHQYHEEIIKPKINEIITTEADNTNEIFKTTEEIIKNYTDADSFLKEQFEEQLNYTESKLNSVDSQLRTDLNTEISNRVIENNRIDSRIDEEALARIARDIELTNHVDEAISKLTKKTELDLISGLTDEAHKRIEEDTAIRTALTTEANLRNEAMNGLHTALNAEIELRSKSDIENLDLWRKEFADGLVIEKTRTATLINNLQEEITSNINNLDSRIAEVVNNISIEENARKEAINQEIINRDNAIASIQSLVVNETQRATEVESTLAANLTEESTLRTKAIKELEDDLKDEIQLIKTTSDTLAADLNIESTTRASQINALASTINTHENLLLNQENKNTEMETALQTTKADLESNITAINTELNNKITNINTLLENEISSRNTNDADLNSKIDKEVNDRIDAIQALSDKVDQDKIDMRTFVYQVDNKIEDESLARTAAIFNLNETMLNADNDLKTQIATVESRRLAGEKLINSIDQRVSSLDLLVSTDATINNKLVDKAYVENLIATETAVFVGTFDTLAEIEAITDAKNNSYAFHRTAEGYSRYKFVAAESKWRFEYSLNNASFTAEQWAAIDSTISRELVSQIITNKNDIIKEINDRTTESIILETRLKAVEDTYSNNNDFNLHKNNTGNPHNVTKEQVGLDKVKNFDLDTEPDLDSPNYITSAAVAKVRLDLNNLISKHINDLNNPHKVTKDQVGLGSVTNKPMVYEVEDSTNYISAGGVKKITDIIQTKLNNHIILENNPHKVTKEQVGLDLVENKAMDEIPSNTDNYIKSRGVKIALDNIQLALDTHKNISNPHKITKETVELDKVVNVAMDEEPTLTSSNYVTSGGVALALAKLNNSISNDINVINSALNLKITKNDIPTHLESFSNANTKYITAEQIPAEYVTDEKLLAKKYLTAIPAEYVTEAELNAKGYLTTHQDISGKVDRTELSKVATSGSYNDLFDKPTLLQGEKGEQGIPGERGENGKSAFDIWKEVGNSGTVQDFIASLKGVAGKDGINGVTPRIGENLNWWIGTVDTGVRAEGIQGIQGEQGIQGVPGKDGIDGKDGYTPVKGLDYFDGIDGKDGINGQDGKDGEKGEKGDKGDQGIQGPQGEKGEQGIQGIQGPKGDTGPTFLDGYKGQVGGEPKAGYITFII